MIEVCPTQKMLDDYIKQADKMSDCQRYELITSYLNDFDVKLSYNTMKMMGMFSEKVNLQKLSNGLMSLRRFEVWSNVKYLVETMSNQFAKNSIKVFISLLDPSSAFIIKEMNGIMAHTDNMDMIFIYIFPESEDWEKAMESILYHEYHHVIRNSFLDNLRDNNRFTLADSIINEGLAEAFVGQLLGYKRVNKWAKSVEKKQLEEFWPLFEENKYETNPDKILSYLNGDLSYGLPHWIGYGMGYEIISSIMAQHKGIGVLELTQLRVGEILSLYNRT